MTEVPPKHNNNRGKWLIWGAVGLFLLVLGFGYRNSVAARPQIGETAPELTMQFYDGYEWQDRAVADLSDLQGNVVLLNFWASWCAPCRQEAATLESVSRAYADQGVVFLGIAWSDTDSKAYEYMAEFDITYPNAPDLSLAAEDLYRFTSVPETYVIGRDGTITAFHIGPISDAQLRTLLDEALANN